MENSETQTTFFQTESAPKSVSSVSQDQILKSKNAVSVFEYTDYRTYLKDFYEFKKAKNPSYTMSNFIRKSGLKENSRGYLKLVIEGKRNLTPNTIRRFTDALDLRGRDSLYFENLVHFNQTHTAKDKQYYFERLAASTKGLECKQFEILRSQMQYCTNWFYVVIRELVGFSDFSEDPAWIATKLKNKISQKQVTDTLSDLSKMGLIQVDSLGRYTQSEPLLKFTGDFVNTVIQKLHLDMIDQARSSIENDPFNERRASFVTLSCAGDEFDRLVEEINHFRDNLTLKFGATSKNVDTVFQVNIQLFKFTETKNERKKS